MHKIDKLLQSFTDELTLWINERVYCKKVIGSLTSLILRVYLLVVLIGSEVRITFLLLPIMAIQSLVLLWNPISEILLVRFVLPLWLIYLLGALIKIHLPRFSLCATLLLLLFQWATLGNQNFRLLVLLVRGFIVDAADQVVHLAIGNVFVFHHSVYFLLRLLIWGKGANDDICAH